MYTKIESVLKRQNPQAVTPSDTSDAAGSAWFDGHRGLWGHIVDMPVILDITQVPPIHLPNGGGCLLLWHHLSRRALLT